MRSIVKVTEAATNERLTTVERVQADLGITGNDAAITTAIDEASSRIEAELGYHLALETVTETFRAGINGYAEAAIALPLERTPVVTIDSITIDARELVDGDWVVDEVSGLLYWLSGTGLSSPWRFCNALSVAYSGGWVMPGETGRTLPPALEAAAVAYCRSMLASRDRDPLLRSVEIPGVITRDYYSHNRAGGESTLLPPDVASMLNPFKRCRV
jgi:hypothetical protein